MSGFSASHVFRFSVRILKRSLNTAILIALAYATCHQNILILAMLVLLTFGGLTPAVGSSASANKSVCVCVRDPTWGAVDLMDHQPSITF